MWGQSVHRFFVPDDKGPDVAWCGDELEVGGREEGGEGGLTLRRQVVGGDHAIGTGFWRHSLLSI